MTPRGSSWRSGFGYRKSSNIYAYTTVKSLDRCTYSIVLTSYLISFMYKTRRCGGITHDDQSEEKNVFHKYQTGCKLQICFLWNCFSWLVQEEPGSSDCSLRVLKFTNYKLFIIKFIEGEQKVHEPGFRPSGNWYTMISMLSLKQKGKSVESQMTTHVIIPPETKFRGGILDSPCSSVRPSVCPSVRPSVRGSVSGW